jgi:predicted PurR-regulated permease PerM
MHRRGPHAAPSVPVAPPPLGIVERRGPGVPIPAVDGDSVASPWRAWALTLSLAGLMGLALFFCGRVLTPFLVGAVLAYLLKGPADRLERRLEPWVGPHRARPLAVVGLFTAGLVLMLLAGVPILISMVSNVLKLADRISLPDVAAYRKTALDLFDHYRGLAHKLPYADRLFDALALHKDEIVITTGKWFQHVGQEAGQLLRDMALAALSNGAQVLNLIFVPVALFYWLYDYETFTAAFWELTPKSHQPWFRHVLQRIHRVLTGFVRGQLSLAAVAGIIFTLGLWAIGIPYASVLGPLAGACTVVPYMNALVVLPCAILGLKTGGWNMHGAILATAVVLLYCAYSVLEGLVLQPRLVGPAVALHPLVILISLPLGAQLAGLQGVVLAVPASACLKVIWEEVRGTLYGPESTFRTSSAAQRRTDLREP